jgi:hypothetical protein
VVYKRLNWGTQEPILSSKLNDMVANDDYLFQNMINGYYDVLGITRDSGLSMRTGLVKGITSEDISYFASHYFSRPFIPGARPVVITSVMSADAMRMIVGVKGLDDRAVPDHRGFMVHFSQFRDAGGATKFYGEYYAGYVAIGQSG